MTANPLPVEFSPIAPATASAGPGTAAAEPADPRTVTDPDAAPQPRGAADFAALLQSAGFAIEAPAADETARIPAETMPEGAAAVTGSGPAIDGLLFLASMQAPLSATDAAAQPAGPATGSGASPRIRVSLEGTGTADGTATRTLDPVDAAIAGKPAAETLLATPLPEASRHPALDPLARDARSDAAGPARIGSRAEPKSESTAAFIPSAGEAARHPLLEALARDVKPFATASSAEPMPSLAPSTSAAAPAPVAIEIDTPVHDTAWRGEAASRIAGLVTRGVEHAELRLTPPDLGPVEMRIDVRGGEATLAIIATQATTRDALEQALPLLRDMLAQQGLSLGQATVQDGRADPQASGGQTAPRAGSFRDESAESTDMNAPAAPRQGLARRLIDVFA